MPSANFSIRATGQAHEQEVAKKGPIKTLTPNLHFIDWNSWPEWSKLTDHLLSKDSSQRPAVPCDEDDAFSTHFDFSEQFLRVSEACLKFSREQPELLSHLSKKYIEAVVENVSPYLFKNGENSVSRMRLFLGGDGSSAMEPEKAQTVDLMRYLLSYMYKPVSTSNGKEIKADGSVETSVRKLLLELFNLSGTVWRSKLTEPTTTEAAFRNEQLSRPQGKSFEMKRGDWICQKCTFMNFARNMSCLECGDARPKRQLTGAEWECPQCDFFNYGRNISCLRCDCKRPGHSVLSPNPADGVEHGKIQTFSQESGGSSSERLGSKSTSDSISRSLDRILSRPITPSVNQRRNPDVPPFVPLPPDMFRKTPESNNGEGKSSDKGIASSPSTSELIDSLLKRSENSMESHGNKESSDASFGWTKTAADHENVGSAPDDDFPDIMPMRKGENRFVVSKKKDRSLTSPAYKRRLAMEQANNYNAIPFVPFPPDYFAKKETQLATDSTETSPENKDEQKLENLEQGSSRILPPQLNQNNYNSVKSYSTRKNGEIEVETPYGSSSQLSSSSHPSTSTRNLSTSFAGPTVNQSQPSDRSWSNERSSSTQGAPQSTGRTPSDGYSGKTLEGSCVKELDPLDMSEEAKAERWFRRAAQIKDISELSEIPDEDFPEIMPMRKGVNRFVISKRKTPLERRLTSPQYRRNFPAVSSEQEKDAED